MTRPLRLTATGGAVATYVEDVFSTYLYTGTNASLTITNNIDLSGKGGMTWIKSRSAAQSNWVNDTNRGGRNTLQTNSTAASLTSGSNTGVVSFLSTGFTLNASNNANLSGGIYASWSFRKQPKFFDVVTYTGTGSATTFAHNLGSVPGCIFIKRTNAIANWSVYHKNLTSADYFLTLNGTAAQSGPNSTLWNSTAPTDSVFSVGTDTTVNASGGAYVAYIFAHNAGGFGLTSTDNVISCGSYTGNGSTTGPVVTLGYEPQLLMIKNASGTGNWQIIDNMRGMAVRGMAVGSVAATLQANLSNAESSVDYVSPTATGFQVTSTSTEVNTSASTYIYIAIRRPMKVPTIGTSVFGLNAKTGTGANDTVTGSAGVSDLAIFKNRGTTPVWAWASRLTGTGYLSSNATTAEVAADTTILQTNPWDVMDGVKVGTTSNITNASANTFINYLFDRAPGFFDVVCYTGNGVEGTQRSHNLQVVPEIIIAKCRSTTTTVWRVLYQPTGITGQLETTDSLGTANREVIFGNDINYISPTSSVFTVGSTTSINGSGRTYVAYLFASCPGVSKVGSYTGNGSSQTINCGFTGGARFVMIKRTDSTGDWYVWDTARGIVANNDPHLSLNTTAAEVTTDDTIDPDSTGFIVNQLAATNINVTSATYIFLAIA